MDHSKNCNLANLDEKAGPLNNAGVSADSSTMSLLLKALSESKADIPAHVLREIKSLELKQNQMKKAPELFLSREILGLAIALKSLENLIAGASVTCYTDCRGLMLLAKPAANNSKMRRYLEF